MSLGIRENVVVTQGTCMMFVLKTEQCGEQVGVRNQGGRKRSDLRVEKEMTKTLKENEINESVPLQL